MKRVIVAIGLTLITACITSGRGGNPSPPVPQPPRMSEQQAGELCTAVWREELDRPEPYIDEEALRVCIEQLVNGVSVETVRENVRSSKEYTDRIARLEQERIDRENRNKLRGRLTIKGSLFYDAEGREFTAVFASALASMTSADRIALFDQLRDAGYNGIRLFAGRLTWAGQDAALVKRELSKILAEARARGLYVLVSALTDTRDWSETPEAWLRTVANLTRASDNVLLEVANEPYHGTQAQSVNDITSLCAMARRVLTGYPNPWTLGAAREDHPVNGAYSTNCGTFNTIHPSRSGNYADLLKVLDGAALVRAVTGKPVMIGEPIGADEVNDPGRRMTDAGFFKRFSNRANTYGLSAVFHSEAGLHGHPLGPKQLAAARAFVAGFAAPRENIPAPVIPKSCEDDPNVDTPIEIVRCQRAKYAGGMDRAQLVAFLKATAKNLNRRNIAGGQWGLLVKTSGNQCLNYSCDIICAGNGPEQRQFDVLGDADPGGAQRPGWDGPLKKIQVRVCEVQ